jgi:hypothetical protein
MLAVVGGIFASSAFAATEPTAPSAPASPAYSTPDTPSEQKRSSGWSFSDLADTLPQYLANRLPVFDRVGNVRFYVRPRLDSLFHSGYTRTPVGAKWQASKRFELFVEAQTYFSHGSDTAASGAGLSGMNFGAKYEHFLPQFNNGGFSLGLNYRTPFNHSPISFTDSYRHLNPYIAATRMLVPSWELLGYGSFGAGFLEHTRLPSNFGKNQLHSNTLALLAGVAREWGRFNVSFTARIASTEFVSDEGRQNLTLRPEVVIPLRRSPNAKTQIFITLGARAIWGPDGFESGTSTGLRVEFKVNRNKKHHFEPKV